MSFSDCFPSSSLIGWYKSHRPPGLKQLKCILLHTLKILSEIDHIKVQFPGGLALSFSVFFSGIVMLSFTSTFRHPFVLTALNASFAWINFSSAIMSIPRFSLKYLFKTTHMHMTNSYTQCIKFIRKSCQLYCWFKLLSLNNLQAWKFDSPYCPAQSIFTKILFFYDNRINDKGYAVKRWDWLPWLERGYMPTSVYIGFMCFALSFEAWPIQ